MDEELSNFEWLIRECYERHFLVPHEMDHGQKFVKLSVIRSEAVFSILGEKNIMLAVRQTPAEGIYWFEKIKVISPDGNVVFTTREYLDFADVYEVINDIAQEELMFDLEFFSDNSVDAKFGPEHFNMNVDMSKYEYIKRPKLLDRLANVYYMITGLLALLFVKIFKRK